MVAYLARGLSGYMIKEVAEHFRRSPMRISQSIIELENGLRKDEGNNLGDVAHNYHNCFPSQEFFLLIAFAMADAPTPTLLAISAIVEINLRDVAQFSHFFFEY